VKTRKVSRCQSKRVLDSSAVLTLRALRTGASYQTTAATPMLKANVNPRVVQEMIGHAKIRQTMDSYFHVLPNMQQQAAERMDAMLG
jgi:site-specific recombinase XerD